VNTGVLIAIIVVVVLLVVAAAVLIPRMRTQRLQQQFGPEYERTVSRAGDRRSAEEDLADRTKRRRELTIVPLEPAAQERYRQEWLATQNTFVDDPAGATRQADELVTRVMRDRGYPVEDDFERQAADVSVDHPQVAENYRAAHTVFQTHERGLAGTDDLRQAFVHYRSLFAELLDGDDRKEAHQ
jgi:hypothetical protein